MTEKVKNDYQYKSNSYQYKSTINNPINEYNKKTDYSKDFKIDSLYNNMDKSLVLRLRTLILKYLK